MTIIDINPHKFLFMYARKTNINYAKPYYYQGTFVDTHLIGVPVKPRRNSLTNRVQEDKEAIGRIFDCVMAHIRETNTNQLSPLDRKQTSIRLLKSLSVRNHRHPSMMNSQAEKLRRQDRPKSWKV